MKSFSSIFLLLLSLALIWSELCPKAHAAMRISHDCPSLQSGLPDVIDGFVGSISGKRVSFDYSFSLSAGSGTKMTGNGHVVFQGDSFKQEGDGLEIYCDGKSKWTVDRSAKEAVAESVDSSSPDYIAYPTFILRDIDKVFAPASVSGNGTTAVSGQKINGEEVVSIGLRPAVPMGNISSASLSFAKGSFRPVAIELHLEDGSGLTLYITGYEVTSSVEDSTFSLDPASLDGEYIVTDLR